MLLETAVQQWEEWLIQTGEIEVCKEHRAAQYHPIANAFKNTFPCTKEKMEKDAEALKRKEKMEKDAEALKRFEEIIWLGPPPSSMDQLSGTRGHGRYQTAP